MSDGVFWLNAQLFRKTKKHFMNMTNDGLSMYIQEHCYAAIQSKIKDLRLCISEHCDKGATTPPEFSDEWCSLEKKSWPIDIINSLEKLIDIFEESPECIVSDVYIEYLERFSQNVVNINTRFSKGSIKGIRTKDVKTSFTEDRAEIFIRFAMIPYFSAEENLVKFVSYLKWLENIDNLLKVSDNENEQLQYFSNETGSIQETVSDYIDTNNYTYVEIDFFNMMQALFYQLYMLSNPLEFVKKEETDQKILEDVKKTYWRHFPNLNILDYTYTLGISEDVLNILIDDAAEDTLTAYRAYCERFKNDQQPSWNECISNSGFYVEMLYFLYRRLSNQESMFLKEIAVKIRDEGYQYKTFINEKAIIAPTVFIKEKCIIEEAEICDNVYLSNCEVSDGVIIEERVTIDAGRIKIKKDVRVKSDVTIKGDISVCIGNFP